MPPAPCSVMASSWSIPTSFALFITMAKLATSADDDHADFMKFLLDSAIESILQSPQRGKNPIINKTETKRRHSLPYMRQPVRYSRQQPKRKRPFRHYQRNEDYYGWYPPYMPMTVKPPVTTTPTEPPTEPPTSFPLNTNKNNNALLAVVAPLALLASLGPLLAAQVMIPWATGSFGYKRDNNRDSKRIKRWLMPPSKEERELPAAAAAMRSSEVKRAVLKLQMIRDYLNEVDQQRSHRDDIMASYLECRGFTDPGDHCLERLACEFADPNNSVISTEREVMAMIIYNIMNNERVNEGLKRRMKKAAIFGYKNSGHCVFFWCYKVDKNNSPAIEIN